MMTAQECPHCHGAIEIEHCAHELLVPSHEVTLLFCDFCARGWETLWRVADGRRVEDFTLEFSGTDPVKLGQFLQRLYDRRAA